jgi:hypothetical protein
MKILLLCLGAGSPSNEATPTMFDWPAKMSICAADWASTSLDPETLEDSENNSHKPKRLGRKLLWLLVGNNGHVTSALGELLPAARELPPSDAA